MTCEQCQKIITEEEPWEYPDDSGNDHFFCSMDCRNTHLDQHTLPATEELKRERLYRNTTIGKTYVKLDRRCPNCHAHRYHSAHRTKRRNKHIVTVTCAECGHNWDGKFRKDEWSDEEPGKPLIEIL